MQNIQHGFTLWKRKGVRFLTIPAFERAGGVKCAFSTRIGGVSPAPYDTLNFSKKREQNPKSFQENIKRFGIATGFDHTNAVSNNYAHSNQLYFVQNSDAGCGIVREAIPAKCDGLFTNMTNLPLITYHADCVPLFFYDPKNPAVAICHAGWRGITEGIIQNAIQSLLNIGCSPSNILTAVGPCISVAHFEVKQDVISIFEDKYSTRVIAQRDNKTYVDLPKACVQDMINWGIVSSNITVSDLCTYANKRLFFSHRRDKGVTGAMAAVIELII